MVSAMAFAVVLWHSALFPTQSKDGFSVCHQGLVRSSRFSVMPLRIRDGQSAHPGTITNTPARVRHALLPPLADGSSAPCGAELFVRREDAPHHIRQSRSCRGREQSVTHSGVRLKTAQGNYPDSQSSTAWRFTVQKSAVRHTERARDTRKPAVFNLNAENFIENQWIVIHRAM